MRAEAIEGWAFAVQASTSYVSTHTHLPALSSGSRVLAAGCDVNATQRVEYAVDGPVLSSLDPGIPAYDDGADPSALDWPADGGSMSAPQVLEYLESRFGVWVPKDSEEWRLPAAGLPTHR